MGSNKNSWVSNRVKHGYLAVLELVVSATLAALAVVQGIFDRRITTADTGLAAGKSCKFNDIN